MHLAGAIPEVGRDRLRQKAKELRNVKERHSPHWLRRQRAIFEEMEIWLDKSEWRAHLQRPDIAEMVVAAIEHRCTRGDWQMFEYVVMPTHLHMFCEIGRDGLRTVMCDFKRWTGQHGAKLLGTSTSRFWQREWFDHWSRSDEEDEKIIQYIRNNPMKAGLVQQFADWPYRGPHLPEGV